MPMPKVLSSSRTSCCGPTVKGMAIAPSTAATSSAHWARIRTRSLPRRSVSTPAGPLTTRVGRVSMAKLSASRNGFSAPSISSQPLAVSPAKDPAVLTPEASRKVVR